MKKLKWIVMALAVMLCCGCGNSSATQESSSESVKLDEYDEITNDVYAKVDLDADMATVYLYYEGARPALSYSAFFYAVQEMEELDLEDYCIYLQNSDGQERLLASELNEVENMEELKKMLPEEWGEYYGRDINTVIINQRESVSIYDVERTIDKKIISVVSEKYGNSADAEPESESEEIETTESNLEFIDSLEYEYAPDNKLGVTIGKDKVTGEISVVSIGSYSEDKDWLLLCDFAMVVSHPFAKGLDVSYMASLGEENYWYIYSDGSLLMNTIPEDLSITEIPEEFSDLLSDSAKKLNDFYAEYGIVEKASNVLVYEDDKMKIYYTGISSKGVEFNVENLTDVNITIQADTVSINGQSTNDIMMSDDVAPQSRGKVIARCDDFSESTEVNTVGGQLKIIDFNKSFKTYNATFVNVDVTE